MKNSLVSLVLFFIISFGLISCNGSGGSPRDSTAPNVPTELTATASGSSSIMLNWTASTDDIGVTGYKIFRNGWEISTSITNTFTDTGLLSSNTYTYYVSAYDAAGHNSAISSAVSAKTLLDPAAPCANPAPVFGSFDSRAPGYMILFQNGVDTQAEVTRLAGIYEFQPTWIYENSAAFTATFLTEVLEQLRCESSIKSIEHDAVVYAH